MAHIAFVCPGLGVIPQGITSGLFSNQQSVNFLKGPGSFHVHPKTMKYLGQWLFYVHPGVTKLGTQLREPIKNVLAEFVR